MTSENTGHDCRRLERIYNRNSDGTVSDTGEYRCMSCDRVVAVTDSERTRTANLDEDERIERTLFHLHSARIAWDRATPGTPALGPGRGTSDWPTLIVAVADGVHRGWVESVEIIGEGTAHTMNYGLTKRGRRALDAYRERMSNYPVVDETGEGDQ